MFERGGRLVGDVAETLTAVATLYRDSNGTYQEKKGKLWVKHPKSTMLGGTSLKTVGLAALKLHEIASGPGSQRLVLPLAQCAEGSTIEITINAKFMGETDDDDVSVMSSEAGGMVGGEGEFGGFDAFQSPQLRVSVPMTQHSGGTDPNAMTASAICSLQDRIADLKSQLASEQQKSREVEEELRIQIKQGNTELRSEVDALRRELDHSKASLHKEIAEHRATQVELEQTREQSRLSQASAREQAGGVEISLKKQMEVLSRERETEVKSLRQEVDSAKEVLRKAQDDLYNMTQEKSRVESESAATAQALKVRASNTEQGLRREMDQISSQLGDEISSLRSQLDNANASLRRDQGAT